ncbi:lycopene cyclase domain-containing protein [Pedobacter metabolipauper]|uniref:Lycopene cyclase domain-containing protein n=1 Tax=Pedobacter metabolipauper TaxID=425513 RepID=A0A4V3D1E1_9SPHI|nr:lycopene cyclase domain-containing protein [Pedobacter metabolipauper]TDQ10257.1 lycopene cyclase domain-containing protein [Pedobacter metabolipauper]
MIYTYLLINLGLLVIPMLLALNRRVSVFSSGLATGAAILAPAILFFIFSFVFNQFGIWQFNPERVLGIYFGQLPVEELLFYVTLPLAGLSVYRYLNVVFPNNELDKFSLSLSNLILGICVAMLFFTYTRWYSVVTFSVLFILLLYIEYLNKIRFMYRFYRAYVVALIPFYVVYGLLTSLPVLTYSDAGLMKLKIGTIPFETHFYFMGMLLLTVYVFEWVQRKANS